MADLVLKMATTLDGLAAGPGGELDFMADFADEEMDRHEVPTLWNAQAHLMGARTFNDMKRFWPITAGPIAEAMNALPKIAFSAHGLDAAGTTPSLGKAEAARDAAGDRVPPSADAHTWDEVEVRSGPVAEELAALKGRAGKPLLVHGGAGFARSVLATGLVDELRLFVFPTALGKGLGIFDGLAAPLAWRTETSMRYRSGVIGLVMRPKR